MAAIRNPGEDEIDSDVGTGRGWSVGRINGTGDGGGAHIDGVTDGVGENVPGANVGT
jgi:hypothetical protein